MSAFTIIASAHNADEGNASEQYLIPYSGSLIEESIERAILDHLLVHFTIEEGDCTDQEAYTPAVESLVIDSYIVVRGQVETLAIFA